MIEANVQATIRNVTSANVKGILLSYVEVRDKLISLMQTLLQKAIVMLMTQTFS